MAYDQHTRDAAAETAPGHVHDQRERAQALGGHDRRVHIVVVGDVAAGRDHPIAQLAGQCLGAGLVTVEDGDAHARGDEVPHGCRAQPTGTAGHQR